MTCMSLLELMDRSCNAVIAKVLPILTQAERVRTTCSVFVFVFFSSNFIHIIVTIAATNYMSMFYLFFGLEKILLGVKQNSIDMYVGLFYTCFLICFIY